MEILEIVDTAVKIGLGALITGTSSYLLTGKNFKQELRKKSIDSNKEMLKDLALKLEYSESFLNEVTHSYLLKQDGSFDSVAMVSACKHVYEARALANLIDEHEMAVKIESLAKILENIYEEFSKPNNHPEVAKYIIKHDDKKQEIYPLVSQCYKKINAS